MVSDDTWGSDHFPIFIQFGASPLSGLRHRPKRKLYTCATDWFMFSDFLRTRMREGLEGALDVQVRYSRFIALLEECVSRATPRPRYGGPTDSRKSVSSGYERNGPPSPW